MADAIGVTFRYDFGKIDAKMNKILSDVFRDTLDQAVHVVKEEFVKQKRWDWPRDTKRKKNRRKGANTLVRAGLRDIYDTAELLKGIKKKYRKPAAGENYVGTVYCDAPHADIVQKGYVTNMGNIVPPRPFLDDGLEYFNFLKRYQENLMNANVKSKLIPGG